MLGFDLSLSTIFMFTGFLLAMYACVSNDIIQTLGAFISSNRHRPRWVIWLYASSILVITLLYGWFTNSGDMAFGRLDRIPWAETFHWYHVLPPIALLILTKKGMPVSTTFLLLTIFSSKLVLGKIVLKSLLGYVVAFAAAIVIYYLIAEIVEKKFLNGGRKKAKRSIIWNTLLWLSTAFLWSQWIMQDMANLFVYLPRQIPFELMIIVLILLVGSMGLMMSTRGGEIQKVVKLKTNTKDIRSATFINFIHAFILFYFKQMNNIPMSTTWVFIGLLAGRELALYYKLHHITSKKVWGHVIKDFLKVSFGLIVSISVVAFINYIDVLIEAAKTFISSNFQPFM